MSKGRIRILAATMVVAVLLSACGGESGGEGSASPGGGTTPDGGTTPPPPSAGTVTLSWTPPTQNEDGSALTDLAGYYVYYGIETGIYNTTIYIDNPGIATYVVDNLTPNTYYFVATSVNGAGVQSAYSNVATRVVN